MYDLKYTGQKHSQATDDTALLSGPLASSEVVYLYRNSLLLGAAFTGTELDLQQQAGERATTVRSGLAKSIRLR